MTCSCALYGSLLSRTPLRKKTCTWIKDIGLQLLLRAKLPNTKVLELNCRYVQTYFQNKTMCIIIINPTCHILRLNKLLQTKNYHSCVVAWNMKFLHFYMYLYIFIQYLSRFLMRNYALSLFFPLFKSGLQFPLELVKWKPASYKRNWEKTVLEKEFHHLSQWKFNRE